MTRGWNHDWNHKMTLDHDDIEQLSQALGRALEAQTEGIAMFVRPLAEQIDRLRDDQLVLTNAVAALQTLLLRERDERERHDAEPWRESLRDDD
jgi:phosphate uptake regulator